MDEQEKQLLEEREEASPSRDASSQELRDEGPHPAERPQEKCWPKEMGGSERIPQGAPFPGMYSPPIRRRPNSMATASLILGVLSLISSIGGLGGMVFGGLGITFAILSRETRRMDTTGRVGLGLSIGGLVLGLFILAVAFMNDPLLTSGEFMDLYQALE